MDEPFPRTAVTASAIATDDAALAGLIRELGWDGSPDDLRELLAGIDAAPPQASRDAWSALIAPDADPRLLERLDEVRAGLALRTAPAGPSPEKRLGALRALLEQEGLDGFVVPRADEHQGEFVAACAERLAWLTGFTGSAGLAVVLRERAAIFVDGRYLLQVADEVDAAGFEIKHMITEPHTEWVRSMLPRNGRLGYDPWLHTVSWVEKMRRAVEAAGGDLVPVERNPIDRIWLNRPPPPLAPVVPYPLELAGVDAAHKRAALANELQQQGVDAAVVTAPDSIAWLLNIRGGDVPHTPLPLSFAVLHRDATVELFMDRRKLVPGLERFLTQAVSVQGPEELGPALDRLGHAGCTVVADPAWASAWVFDRLHRSGATVKRDADPCVLPKACKNATELAGCRIAHRRDGIAVTRLLAWLAQEAPGGGLTEQEVADTLLRLRREGERFRGLSFDTIAGAGANGAIVHYRVTKKSNFPLRAGSLFLIDSGGQYLDGTTDVTRTVAVGEPTPEMRQRFTLVLKGHVALATARFPVGTTGSQLDPLARQFLWRAGLDYDHGTGHGVGCYLGVHEGPQRLSKLPNNVALQPGMILSNEPGYYKTGEYGIRIENLVVVREADVAGAELPMLELETLTLAPIDRRLIDPTLLTLEESAWIDAYHARVQDVLGPDLPEPVRDWLAEVAAPLGPALVNG